MLDMIYVYVCKYYIHIIFFNSLFIDQSNKSNRSFFENAKDFHREEISMYKCIFLVL